MNEFIKLNITFSYIKIIIINICLLRYNAFNCMDLNIFKNYQNSRK